MTDAKPTVVIVHDWYGVLPHLNALADRITHATGFDVRVADLYGGSSTTEPDEAEKLMTALDDEQTLARLATFIDNLRTDDGATHVGVVGFSMGGFFASVASALVPVDALVLFYATALGERIACPVQGHFAARDDFPPGQTPGAFFDRVVAAGAPVEVFGYADTEHSFANADVHPFHPSAAALAEARTTAFLGANLRG